MIWKIIFIFYIYIWSYTFSIHYWIRLVYSFCSLYLDSKQEVRVWTMDQGWIQGRWMHSSSPPPSLRPQDPILYREKPIFYTSVNKNWSKLSKITHYPAPPKIYGSTSAWDLSRHLAKENLYSQAGPTFLHLWTGVSFRALVMQPPYKKMQ